MGCSIWFLISIFFVISFVGLVLASFWGWAGHVAAEGVSDSDLMLS